MITNIVKWGNSQGIRLPKHLLESIELSDNDTVEVITKNNSIIIKKSVKKACSKTIKERFMDFDGEYKPLEMAWGEPVGKEIW